MAEMRRSDVATRRLRVIRDAAWLLEHDSPTSALAALLSEINKTSREPSPPPRNEGNHVSDRGLLLDGAGQRP
jgi:hypothetical protein